MRGDVYTCPGCKRNYRVQVANVSCTVVHGRGECCHVGDVEVFTSSRATQALPESFFANRLRRAQPWILQYPCFPHDGNTPDPFDYFAIPESSPT